MVKIAIVGCTGKLGNIIMKSALKNSDVEVCYAVARKGNRFVGKKLSELLDVKSELMIIDDIELADDCDVYIDCTNAETFMSSSYSKYEKMQKPIIIATTAFSTDDIEKIKQLATNIPIFMSGNFSVALYDFIETLKFYARKISLDTDVQILEYHHNQKQDAPSGTALMIKDALLDANEVLNDAGVSICSIRGGNIFGEHEVIFASDNLKKCVSFAKQI